jgi:Flp pilus assembly pilin Flp
MVMHLVEMLQQRINNEKGAEIVEWVLWVGGIAILAGTLYTVVSGSLTTTITTIVGNITGVTGS